MERRPVYRSLNKPLTILGVERKLFFSILLVAYALFQFGEALLPAIVLFCCLWLAAKSVTQIDHQLLRIVLNSNRFTSRYDPALRGKGGAKGG
jgi:type IV secretory pathway VirB3-like protein